MCKHCASVWLKEKAACEIIQPWRRCLCGENIIPTQKGGKSETARFGPYRWLWDRIGTELLPVRLLLAMSYAICRMPTLSGVHIYTGTGSIGELSQTRSRTTTLCETFAWTIRMAFMSLLFLAMLLPP